MRDVGVSFTNAPLTCSMVHPLLCVAPFFFSPFTIPRLCRGVYRSSYVSHFSPESCAVQLSVSVRSGGPCAGPCPVDVSFLPSA